MNDHSLGTNWLLSTCKLENTYDLKEMASMSFQKVHWQFITCGTVKNFQDGDKGSTWNIGTELLVWGKILIPPISIASSTSIFSIKILFCIKKLKGRNPALLSDRITRKMSLTVKPTGQVYFKTNQLKDIKISRKKNKNYKGGRICALESLEDNLFWT